MNTREDAERVIAHFGIETVKQVDEVIRESLRRHPDDAQCLCVAMEALGVLIRLPSQGGVG